MIIYGYPAVLVKFKFLNLSYSHIEYVIGCMGKNTIKVLNIKAYLLAALLNAGSTMGSHYKAEVNHDMSQFAGWSIDKIIIENLLTSCDTIKIEGERMIDIVKGDITKIKGYDAIVNAANNTLLGGGGVDGAIHKAAGPCLLEECRKLKGCETGEAKITRAYNLDCEYVIHTVGPIWKDGLSGESSLLKKSYENVLKLAYENGIMKIAFPSISTGKYKYPVELAAHVACKTVYDFLNEHADKEFQIIWVLFDDKTYQEYQKALNDLQKNDWWNSDYNIQYIDY